MKMKTLLLPNHTETNETTTKVRSLSTIKQSVLTFTLLTLVLLIPLAPSLYANQCDWDFDFVTPTDEQSFETGSRVYVKVDAEQSQDIENMELFINNQSVRTENHSPYEWGKSNSDNDAELRNMQAGTYDLKVRVLDKCGKTHEKNQTLYIQNTVAQCNWGFDFDMSADQHFENGSSVYVKVSAYEPRDVEWMELYISNQYVRKESNAPYEWGKLNSNQDQCAL